MNNTTKKFLRPFQKFAQFYAGLNFLVRIPIFALMALPFVGMFLGIWFGLGSTDANGIPLLEEGSFLRWILAVIPSMGLFIAAMFGLSKISTTDLKIKDEE